MKNEVETKKENEADLLDMLLDFELEVGKFNIVLTLLEEVDNDLSPVINFDGTHADEEKKANLLNRRPVMEDLLWAARDYIMQLKKYCDNMIKQAVRRD